jgi:hypothetical protein
MVHLELDFRIVLKPGYLSVALPEFNIMAINKLLCRSVASISLALSSGTELRKCPSEPMTQTRYSGMLPLPLHRRERNALSHR